MLRALLPIVCLMRAFPARGLGQVAPADARLPVLEREKVVWVTTADGVVRGRFRAWADSTFEWDTPAGLVRTPLSAIERIETPDKIRDGVLRGTWLGAGAAGGFGLLISIGLSCRTDCGTGYSRGRDIAVGTLSFALIGAGSGAAAGAILDALIHRRHLIYARSGSAHVYFTPVITAGGRGAAVGLTW